MMSREEENCSDRVGDGDGGSLGTPIQGEVATDLEVDSQSKELDDSEFWFLNGGKIHIDETVTQVVKVFHQECHSLLKKYKRDMEARLDESSRENDELRQKVERLIAERNEGTVSQREGIKLLSAENTELKKKLEEKEEQLRSLKDNVVERFKFMVDQISPSQSRSEGSFSIQIKEEEKVNVVQGQKQPLNEDSRTKFKSVTNTTWTSGTPVATAQNNSPSPTTCYSLSDPAPGKRKKAKRSRSSRFSSDIEKTPVSRSPSMSSPIDRSRRDRYRKEFNQPAKPFFRKQCQCGVQFTSAELLDKHPCPFRNRRKFKCETCKYRFADLLSLKQHLRDTHNEELSPDKKVGCKGCGDIFSAKEMLLGHWGISGCPPEASYL